MQNFGNIPFLKMQLLQINLLFHSLWDTDFNKTQDYILTTNYMICTNIIPINFDWVDTFHLNWCYLKSINRSKFFTKIIKLGSNKVLTYTKESYLFDWYDACLMKTALKFILCRKYWLNLTFLLQKLSGK